MRFMAPLDADPPEKRSPGACRTEANSTCGSVASKYISETEDKQRPSMRTADRKARRAEAQRVLRHLGDLVVWHKTNDEKGSHITRWLTATRRLEWWPATLRWHDSRTGMMRGSAADLLAFLKAQ